MQPTGAPTFHMRQRAPLAAYLAADDVVQAAHPTVRALCRELTDGCADETEKARRLYEAVRDRFPHSFDIHGEGVAVTAGDVLRLGHGICFAKSHLLAALLRAAGTPAGLCYQRLMLDDAHDPRLTLHGLNAVWLSGRWLRLDARGNKPGVDARFCPPAERLAFPVRPAHREADLLLLFPSPDANVLRALRTSRSVSELWQNLPAALAADAPE